LTSLASIYAFSSAYYQEQLKKKEYVPSIIAMHIEGMENQFIATYVVPT